MTGFADLAPHAPRHVNAWCGRQWAKTSFMGVQRCKMVELGCSMKSARPRRWPTIYKMEATHTHNWFALRTFGFCREPVGFEDTRPV